MAGPLTIRYGVLQASRDDIWRFRHGMSPVHVEDVVSVAGQVLPQVASLLSLSQQTPVLYSTIADSRPRVFAHDPLP